MNDPDAAAGPFLGIAGPTASEQERASLKQAVFLLRYRARILAAAAATAPGAD